MIDAKIAAALRAPFPADKVGKLPKVNCGDCSSRDKTCTKHKRSTCKTCNAYISTQHIHIDYVGHADVTDRLLSVDPDWSWRPMAIGDNGLPTLDANRGMWIELTVGGKTALGYGHAGAKTGGDAVKETIGDALRNAAMRFGVALDMWRKEKLDPIVDAPEARTEPAAPVDRKAELRKQIAYLGGLPPRAWDINKTASEFTEWSRGQQIQTATIPVLAEFVDHLQHGGGVESP